MHAYDTRYATFSSARVCYGYARSVFCQRWRGVRYAPRGALRRRNGELTRDSILPFFERAVDILRHCRRHEYDIHCRRHRRYTIHNMLSRHDSTRLSSLIFAARRCCRAFDAATRHEGYQRQRRSCRYFTVVLRAGAMFAVDA